ncbi:hypothetical protein [Streptomyces virginiae]|uniref:hypothetical protein n=1 Tax=Streptomyces virginiae TaxID=1961 RepID=UPI0022528956|nr:hypothetical protein [Streptomyces virginiae]MCX4716474.1 hypothetical protein [Streptomyces virginiae]MCX5274251.1 hypothetical protein [Streptomyces virginiae]
MGLAEEMAAMRGGSGHSGRLLGEFRRTALLVPLSEGDDGGLMSGRQGGVRWIYAFTDEEALARFAEARGAGAGAREWEYLSILGARLLDAVIPTVDGPTGVAVDVADEDGSMLFPPVVGIVPDACAVDAGPDRAEAV